MSLKKNQQPGEKLMAEDLSAGRAALHIESNFGNQVIESRQE